jgi:hypothetical protein
VLQTRANGASIFGLHVVRTLDICGLIAITFVKMAEACLDRICHRAIIAYLTWPLGKLH